MARVESTYPNCSPRVDGTRTVLPCQLLVPQHELHWALDTPTRHWPATAGLELVKYEMDQLHETVAPRELTPLMLSEAWLTSVRPMAVHDDRATGSVQPEMLPLPQGTNSTGMVVPVTLSTVPLALTHDPDTQLCPEPHTRPHEPQLLPLVCRSTQVLLQSVCPVGHGVMQVPLEQVWPDEHARPQAPQWLVLLSRLASQPLLVLLSQLANPAAHAPSTQPPAAHDAPALLKLHIRPQAPQWVGSLRGSTQVPPQLMSGVAQVAAQVPPEHT